MNYLFSELCDKEVINCSSGTSIGFVSDITICADDGKILNLIVCPDSGLVFKKSGSICIPWEKVEKIGKDFIIVNGSFSLFDDINDKKKSGLKKFFSKNQF